MENKMSHANHYTQQNSITRMIDFAPLQPHANNNQVYNGV